MSDTIPPPPAPPPANGQQQPPLVVNLQYTKDLSFEVPGAPETYLTLKQQPQVNINLDVQARRLNDTQQMYEITLAIKVEANSDNKPVFIAELAYCGLFTLNSIPEQAVEPVLLVECPRILFPFARNILADVTRDGGFPPVMLTPIDFLALWQSRRGQATVSGTA
jgi:preprotein translocase subunit SecB